jgi:predicted 3-demethylubiquinone-9 3-methyltransferase (glyoxalase superfamily)
MFEGKTEEAINFLHYPVKNSLFSLNRQTLMCSDSPIKHDFTFTPSTSLFVTCNSKPEIHELTEKLAVY